MYLDVDADGPADGGGRMIIEFLLVNVLSFMQNFESFALSWTDGLPYLSTIEGYWTDGLDTFAGPLPAVICGPCLAMVATTLQFAMAVWLMNGAYRGVLRIRRLLPV